MDNNPHLIHFIGHQADEMKVMIMMARAQGNVKDLLQESRLQRKHQGNEAMSPPPPSSSSSSSSSLELEDDAVFLSVKVKLGIAIQVSLRPDVMHACMCGQGWFCEKHLNFDSEILLE